MEKILVRLIGILIVLVLGVGILALGSWIVSILLNVVFVQLGLGEINIWGVLCLTSALQIIYKYIKW